MPCGVGRQRRAMATATAAQGNGWVVILNGQITGLLQYLLTMSTSNTIAQLHAAVALPSGDSAVNGSEVAGAMAVFGGRAFGEEGSATTAWRCDL